jgi:hypothetical protein
LILVLSIFNIAFWLYILSSGQKKEALISSSRKQEEEEQEVDGIMMVMREGNASLGFFVLLFFSRDHDDDCVLQCTCMISLFCKSCSEGAWRTRRRRMREVPPSASRLDWRNCASVLQNPLPPLLN